MCDRYRSTFIALLIPGLLVVDLTNAWGAVEGEGAEKEMVATRTAAPPKIDGRLDEPEWSTAAADEQFTQLFPDEAKAPSERTSVRVLFDDTALYVGVHLYDRDPAAIVSRLSARDLEIEADSVSLFIDSQHDHNTAYGFGLSAAGVQRDLLHFNDVDESSEWDAVWTGATVRGADGWTAEFRIPLSILRFSAESSREWGFQVRRYISRRKEVDLWTYTPSTVRGVVSRAGHLVGLGEVHAGRTFELRSTFLAELHARSPDLSFFGQPGPSETSLRTDAALDVKLGLTNDLTLDTTFNPDFGQVELDEAQLNLTYLEAYFSEKRPFFLEGLEYFEMPQRLFYSRRIGAGAAGIGAELVNEEGETLTVAGTPDRPRILNATRVVGQLTPKLGIAVVQAFTGAQDVETRDAAGARRDVRLTPIKSFTVLRGRYSLGGPSLVGLTATAAQRIGEDRTVFAARDNHDSFVVGADGQWQSEGGSLRMNGQLAATQRVGGTPLRTPAGRACHLQTPACLAITRSDGTTIAPGDQGLGATVYVEHSGEFWFQNIDARTFTPGYDVNDVGFGTDFNRHSVTVEAGYRNHQGEGPVPELDMYLAAEGHVDYRGVPLQRTMQAGVDTTYRSFMSQKFVFGAQLPGGFQTNETGDGARVELPPGVMANVWTRTDPRRVVVGTVDTGGTYYLSEGFYAFHLSGGLEVQLPRLELELSFGVGIDLRGVVGDCVDPAGNTCTVETSQRRYITGDAKSPYASGTLKVRFTVSPKLSLQGIGEVVGGSDSYSRFREVQTVGTRPYVRYDELMPSAFNGDIDGNGTNDLDAVNVSVKLRAVLRWEFSPGSSLFAVYTRIQSSADGDQRLRNFAGLALGQTEDLLLAKLVLFWR